MDKRYQVFVSSTFEDLKAQRQEVMQALLELDCIPSGMELFPAADDDQWTLIKRVIDDCDYYIVIIAGRYGSIGPQGLSYTQMEYEYAVEKGKPVIAFLYKDTGDLPSKLVEADTESKAKLEKFRALAKQKVCRYWESSKELGSVVSRSLIRLIKDHPAVGWVRADLVPNETAANEMLRLRKRIEDLESALERAETEPPSGTDILAQGDDPVPIQYTAFTFPGSIASGAQRYDRVCQTTWNRIFSSVAPLMIDEVGEQVLRRSLDTFIMATAGAEIQKHFEGARITEIRISGNDFQTIKVQLRALGLMEQSAKQRSLKDKDTYWTLTPLGDKTMTQLRAVKRPDTTK